MHAQLTLDVAGLTGDEITALLSIAELFQNQGHLSFNDLMAALYRIGFALDGLDVLAWYEEQKRYTDREKVHEAVTLLGGLLGWIGRFVEPQQEVHDDA